MYLCNSTTRQHYPFDSISTLELSQLSACLVDDSRRISSRDTHNHKVGSKGVRPTWHLPFSMRFRFMSVDMRTIDTPSRVPYALLLSPDCLLVMSS